MPRYKTIRLSFHEQPTDEMLQNPNITVVKSFGVREAVYSKLELKGKPPALLVSYFCYGAEHSYKEIFFLENTGFSRTVAERWWSQRATSPVPATVDEALKSVKRLETPEVLHVSIKGKHPLIMESFGKLKQQSVRVFKGRR